MEKQPVRAKGNTIFKFLQKPASLSSPNLPYSPTGDKRPTAFLPNKAFSGPILIPREARRKPKNGSFEAQEPTSPKVSCIGQVKHKKKKKKKKQSSPTQQESKPSLLFGLGKMFQCKVRPGRRSDADADVIRRPTVSAPPIGQMKRFMSGRETLANFDWKAESGLDEESDGEDEVIVPHSAPIVVGGGVGVEPKKEVNLWKRRTVDPPMPLQLKKK